MIGRVVGTFQSPYRFRQLCRQFANFLLSFLCFLLSPSSINVFFTTTEATVDVVVTVAVAAVVDADVVVLETRKSGFLSPSSAVW